MQRVLVTGGAGFIGSNFIRRLLARHPAVRVVNLDKLTYAGNRANLRDVEQDPRYRFLEGDVSGVADVTRALEGCDAVVHFAAETHVDRSITDATPFLRTNVLGTAVLLDAARTCRVQQFLHVSTDEVYGEILEGAATEEFPLKPRSPYAASKASADLLALAAHVTYGQPVIVTRSSNNYGPYQFPEKMVPLCLTNLLEGEPFPLYGDGQHVRDWLYVEDHCDALLFLLEHGRPGETYNISGGQLLANRELVTLILRELDRGNEMVQPVPDRPGHDRRYALDGTKLARLGWRPRATLREGLQATVAWYQAHIEWWKPLKERLRADPYHWLHRAPRPGRSRTSGIGA